MEHTGRISRTIRRTARTILFGETVDAAVAAELPFIAEVDRAHVVMLAEAGLVDRAAAAALLRAIDDLAGSGFAPLRGRAAPRGAYVLYEGHLIDETSIAVGGMLQLGRSRNDLNATTLRLRLRGTCVGLLRAALRLQAVLLRRARRHADAVMPAYTHFQPAVPITYGHYLAGVASAIDRDLGDLLAATSELDACPLGACAVGGTSLPIRAERTAALLGFLAPKDSSIDAVASRDVALRLLGAAAIFGVTLSRAATDLLLWTAPEYGFLELPDHLVGSSSMMPQKRNAYFLEHVQGRSVAALGAFTHAAAACHAKPFTNSIAVGTEAAGAVWDGLDQVAEAATLLRLVVAEAAPVRAAMLDGAERGYTCATELANRFVLGGGASFRAAHHAVGVVIREALAAGEPLGAAAMRLGEGVTRGASLAGLDPASVALASEHGGGPGPASIQRCLERLERAWSARAVALRERAERWRSAESELRIEVEKLVGSRGTSV